MSVSSDSQSSSPQTYQPAVPVDLIRGSYHSAMAPPPQITVTETNRSVESSGASLKSPRTPRFAEATSIHSPIENLNQIPFADPSKSQSQGVGDVGFGYVSANNPIQYAEDSRPPLSPLRSGLKIPQTARSLNPLSPTFREEYFLEKQEKHTEKENARDLVSKCISLSQNIPRYRQHTDLRAENQASCPYC